MTSLGPRVRCRGVVDTIDYAPSATFGPRRLTDFEFVWVLRGEAELRVLTVPAEHGDGDGTDRLRTRLRPGLLALTRRGTVDSYQWTATRTSTHAWVHFDLVEPGPLPPTSTWPTTRSLDDPVLAGLCDYLIRIGTRPDATTRARTDQLVGLLLDLFVTGQPSDQTPELPPYVAVAAQHVRTRWRRDGPGLVDVADLAVAAGVSVGHLHRVFRTAYGVGPARALELVRLSRAATVLRRSNATLTQIAEQTGFANPYHLSRRFAGVYGRPPGAYRRQHDDPSDPYAPLEAAGLRPFAAALTA